MVVACVIVISVVVTVAAVVTVTVNVVVAVVVTVAVAVTVTATVTVVVALALVVTVAVAVTVALTQHHRHPVPQTMHRLQLRRGDKGHRQGAREGVGKGHPASEGEGVQGHVRRADGGLVSVVGQLVEEDESAEVGECGG